MSDGSVAVGTAGYAKFNVRMTHEFAHRYFMTLNAVVLQDAQVLGANSDGFFEIL